MLTQTDYFILIGLITFWCVGLTIASEERKILFPIKQLLSQFTSWIASLFVRGDKENDQVKEKRKVLAEQIMNPLIGCIWCMASVHTAILLISYQFFFRDCLTWMDFVNWIVLAVPAIVLNGVLYNLVQLLRLTVRELENK